MKNEITLLRDFQKDILASVYWSLGGVFLLALALAGFSWFSNFRVYERDKRQLTTELDQRLDARLLDERARAGNAVEALRQELRTRDDQLLRDHQAAADVARQALETRVFQRVDDAEKTARKDLRVVELRMAYSQRLAAERDGRFSSAITHAIDELEASIALEWPYPVKTALNGLSKNIDQGGKFTPYELQKLPEILKRVPAKYAALREEVSTKLGSAKVFTLEPEPDA